MSASVVFVEPYVPPAPPIPPLRGVQILWRGWDGSEWDLTSPESGIVIARDGGARGFGSPDHERWSREAPLVAGSVHLGHQVKDREIHLPLYIFGDGTSEGFVARNRAFWKTMHPDREGTLTVVHLDGTRRHIDCRFQDDSNYSIDVDPIQKGWELYAVNLIADDPYWYGDLATSSASVGIEAEWMEDTGPEDDVFMTISDGDALADAKIRNDGDVDTHPVWWVHGPFASAVVGFGTRTVSIPFGLAAGKTLVVNTHPTSRSAKEINSPTLSAPIDAQIAQVEARLPGATNRTKDLGANSNLNGKIPAGGTQQVNITLTGGAGSIRMILYPRYYRAW